MAELITYTQVEAELAATAAYDGDVSLARRRIAALRRKLDFAEQSDENGRMIRFNHQVVQAQINQVSTHIQTITANGQSASAAEMMTDPSVIHSDFSGLRGYV